MIRKIESGPGRKKTRPVYGRRIGLLAPFVPGRDSVLLDDLTPALKRWAIVRRKQRSKSPLADRLKVESESRCNIVTLLTLLTSA